MILTFGYQVVREILYHALNRKGLQLWTVALMTEFLLRCLTFYQIIKLYVLVCVKLGRLDCLHMLEKKGDLALLPSSLLLGLF